MSMDAKVSPGYQFLTCIDSEKIARKRGSSVLFSQKLREKQTRQAFIRPSNWKRTVSSEFSCSFKNNPAVVFESGSFHAPSDEALILKNKSQEIVPYLNGRCIYLVGMMGSGKTTVGKVLSQVLHYSFSDCDTIVEEEVGTSVADMFKLYGEGFFRDKETEALRTLSSMHRLVVSTGGGAVIRPVNWKYMQKGISVWFDVPLDALAQRITAVGTNSRPLLHHDSGDVYSKALTRLSNLLEERGEAYANAKAKVSLEKIAAKQGIRNVLNLSPTLIAIEAVEQIEGLLKREGEYYAF